MVTLLAAAPVLLTESVQLTGPPAFCTLGVLVTVRTGLVGVLALLLVALRELPQLSR